MISPQVPGYGYTHGCFSEYRFAHAQWFEACRLNGGHMRVTRTSVFGMEDVF